MKKIKGKEEGDVILVERQLPEIIVTPYEAHIATLREHYLYIPGEMYNRNPALFRQAIRFMQKNHDLKGEAYIFNKSVNAATNRVAREFVLPVLLGVAAMPIILEAGPVVTFLKAVYTNPATWLRMGVNWSVQTYVSGINEVDYVSVVAEGFTVGGSAVSALIEIRPTSEEWPKLRVGFINKSFGDTSVDIVTRALGAGATKYFGRQMKDYLKYDGSSILYKSLVQGIGTYFYTHYQIITTSLTETVKKKMKKENEGLE